MRKIMSPLLGLALLLACSVPVAAQSLGGVVALSEPGFPSADSASPAPKLMETALAGAQFVSAAQLSVILQDSATHLLIMGYGSVFPEQAWPAIQDFLHRGGNLLVLGGRPFTRAAYHDASGWHLRDYSVRFTRPLMIDQYETTPGSEGTLFQTNPDLAPQLPRFDWKRAFSPVIRLSAVDLYKRGGAAGSIDARVDALAWGVQDGRKMAAPAIQIDHLRNGFDGGRWIFLNAELTPDFYASPQVAGTIRALVDSALQGSQEFTVRPTLPLYLPGEPVELDVQFHAAHLAPGALTLKITTYPEADPANRAVTTVPLPSQELPVLPAPVSKGLQIIEAEVSRGGKVLGIYHSGFWIRDEAYLRSGPRLTVNHDYFEFDGHPLAVVGTTYMSSEAQRLYFEYPNAYVWNRELGQIHAAGLNMIRTGWWTGWDKFCDENGRPYERTLRTLEAYLMTARKNGLPVQFNFFAFLPEVLGGINPYLDPQAVQRQRTLISSVVARFHDVPFLAWDLINEPSISQHLWTMRPNGDAIELAKWNEWLNRRYTDRAALAAAWNLAVALVEGTVALPEEIEFTARGMYVGHNSLKLYDYFVFAQNCFQDWVRTMRDAIRGTGSQQLVTVGQDEGGIEDRLSPAYWEQFVDFTTNHSWWQTDSGLWDSLLAKQPGKTMLIQETGLQRELHMDEVARRTTESEAALLERKVAMSFVQGSGAIEWLWNTNSYMTESNETPIGLVRPDSTEKPEATVMRAMAQFAKPLSEHLRQPVQPGIAIITSQAAQFSVIADLQIEAQRNAIRALAYYGHLTPYVIAENQIAKLGSPKLAILPSPQVLTDATWRALLKYADDGGTLLITGPVERDEHWQRTTRMAELKLDALTEPLTYHAASLRLGDREVALTFDQQKQSWLDALRFADGTTLKEISRGKGRIFWAAYPVELAEGTQAAADLYMYVASRAGVEPRYELSSAISSGVLVFPLELQDSVLYVLVSDSADDADLDIRDKLTGVHVTLRLFAEHAAMALIGKQEKSILAKYGFN